MPPENGAAVTFGLESANVVGYQEVATPAGYSMRAATFQAIDGEYKISDIKVAGDDIGYGNEYGQVVEADGSWGATYYYLSVNVGAPEDGWYKDMFGAEPVTDEDTLSVGQAFFFNASMDVTLTYSGQVITGRPSVALPAGSSMLGNPTPITAKFSEITVTGEDVGYGNEYGQKVLPSGDWGDTYYYLSVNVGAPEDGWYKDMFGTDPVTDSDVIEAGESLFFNSSANIVVTFPSAL